MGIEAMIEKAAREYMQAQGGVLLKFTSPGNAGVPDRIASHAACGPFLMEFKAPGKTLSPAQRNTCTDLAEKGFRVYAGTNWRGVNSIAMAREIIDDELRGTPGARHYCLGGFLK